MLKIIECPRDAMQGIKNFIPTEVKAAYINALLKIGFDTIDFGSFVSPKAIPQMRDTADLLSMLDLENTDTDLLAIVANQRGALQAASFDEITYVGFPFSISETFQMRNTNSTIQESLSRIVDIQNICGKSGKQLVAYLSMGFGNPYGDEWNVEIVEKWTKTLQEIGVSIIQLSDTIGVSTPDSIEYLFSSLIPSMPDVEFGAHLHTAPLSWRNKVEAAYKSGCRRFDGAIKGYGGCPMAHDELTGNMPTELMIEYFDALAIDMTFNRKNLSQAIKIAVDLFNTYH